VHGSSVARGLKQHWGCQKNGDFFCNFGRHIFGTSRVVPNIVTRRHEVNYRLSAKMLDLEGRPLFLGLLKIPHVTYNET